MGAFDIIAKVAKGAKKAPFYSKIDEVLESMPRNKGTGAEFLREIEKAKGVKPAEIQDRGIVKALKDKPKMTKAEVQKILEENPPPRVQEKVLGDAPDYDEFVEVKAQELYDVDYFDLTRDERRRIDSMFNEIPATKYEQYKTPGGENYREILLKLPSFDDKRIMELEADIRRLAPAYKTPENIPFIKEKMDELASLRRQQASAGAPYVSSHYRDDPNLLAHIRVQDFTTPEGKKVLLVDEIQSDWHQAGRDLRNKEIKRIMSETGVDKKTASAQVPDDFGYKTKEQPREAKTVIDRGGYWEVRDQNNEFITNIMGYQYPNADQAKILEVANARISADLPTQIKQSEQVPDAPFKKNWHELAMKRVMDYAAENGYDTVAITPGVEQVKRYEDATRQAVDEVAMYGDTLVGFKGGRKVIEQPISSPDELEQYIGKDMAQKLASAPPDMNFIRSIKGEDITVGGEGMKGFYDEKLVNYLNDFGKPYGSSVGQIELKKPITRAWSIEDLYRDTGITPDQWQQMSVPERIALRDKHSADFSNREEFENYGTFHSFDITPQLREEVKTKGLPLYSKTGMGPEGLAAGTGAATIGSEVFDTNNEQQVQNPVHFTENPDAMLLELMQRN